MEKLAEIMAVAAARAFVDVTHDIAIKNIEQHRKEQYKKVCDFSIELLGKDITEGYTRFPIKPPSDLQDEYVKKLYAGYARNKKLFGWRRND